MKATLLVENNSLFDTFFHAEHGYSLYIADGDKRILYDTGYSDAVVKNAVKMGIDLAGLDYIIVSHAHYDHSGGVKHIIKYFKDNAVARRPVMLMTGPEIFRKRYMIKEGRDISFDVDPDILEKYFKVEFEPKTRWLTPNLVYLGKVERNNAFECRIPQVPKILIDGVYHDDYVEDDTQLAYLHENKEEVSVFSGCSHNGMCNIMEYAKKVTGAKRINTFLGGLHLQGPTEEVIASTVDYVKGAKVKNFYPCHDTDMPSKLRLAAVSNFREAGVSLQVELI